MSGMTEDRIVLDLHRYFQAYRWLDEPQVRAKLSASAIDILQEVARHRAFDIWQSIYRSSQDTPAHRRFVVSWCLRIIHFFHQNELIQRDAYHTIVRSMEADLNRIPEGDPRYRFDDDGGQGPVADRLRRLYLTHSLLVKLHSLSEIDVVPADLYQALRRDLVERAAALFSQIFEGKELPAGPPSHEVFLQAIDDYERRKLLDSRTAGKLRTYLRSTDPTAASDPAETLPGTFVPGVTEVPSEHAAGKPTAEVLSGIEIEATPEMLRRRQEIGALLELNRRMVRVPELEPRRLWGYQERVRFELDECVRHLSSPPDAATLERVARRIELPWDRIGPHILGTAPAERPPDDITFVGDEAEPGEWAREMVAKMGKEARPVVTPVTPDEAPPRPRPPPPRKPVLIQEDRSSGRPPLLTAFFNELGINWLLYSGILLVLAAGVLLAVKNWGRMGPVSHYMFLLGATGGFFGLALSTRIGMKLERTPMAFFGLVLLFTPLNMVAMHLLGLVEPGPLMLAALLGGLCLLAMNLAGSHLLLRLENPLPAAGFFGVSCGYLVASRLAPHLVNDWQRAGVLLASMLAARFVLTRSLRSLEERGLLPLFLAPFSVTLMATGLVLAPGVVMAGFSLYAIGHLLFECGSTAASIDLGPLRKEGSWTSRLLVLVGEGLSIAGLGLLWAGHPPTDPLSFLVLLHLSRTLYRSFVQFENLFEFLAFLPTPGILVLLLPHVHPQLHALLLEPLLRKVAGDPLGILVVHLLPLVLAAPFYGRLAERLVQRGLAEQRGVLHIAGATLALVMLGVSLVYHWPGFVAGLITAGAWTFLGLTLRFRYMILLALLGGALTIIEWLWILGLPHWIWLLVVVGIAHALLEVHVRRGLQDFADFNDFLCPGDPVLQTSITLGTAGILGYGLCVADGQVVGPHGYLFDLGLIALFTYFLRLQWSRFHPIGAYLPGTLLLVEFWVLTSRLGWWSSEYAGLLLVVGSLIPLTLAWILHSDFGREWSQHAGPPGMRDDAARRGLAELYARTGQVISILAILGQPAWDAGGAVKFASIALIQGYLSRWFSEATFFAVLAGTLAVHAPFLDNVDRPDVCFLIQVVDLVIGAALLRGARMGGAARGVSGPWQVMHYLGNVLLLLSVVFFVSPIPGGRGDQDTLMACAVMTGTGLGLLWLAQPLASEGAVYLGEILLGLVYLRLRAEGVVGATAILPFLATVASFFLFGTHRRIFTGWLRVYQNPARTTAWLLPALAVVRGLAEGDAPGALLIFFAAVTYHAASVTERSHEGLVLALVLYNVASAVAPAGPPWLHGTRYLFPLALTLLAYSHAPFAGASRDQVSLHRKAALVLMFWDVLPRALLGRITDAAFLLSILLSLAVGAMGLMLRIRIYLWAGVFFLTGTVLGFLVKQVLEVTQLGLFSMLLIGIMLILLAAVFEGARERLRKVLADLEDRFRDWD